MKIKKRPTLKEKSRYIVFKVHTKEPLSFLDMKNAVWNSILNFLGEEQAARSDIKIIKNLWKNETGFLKCNHNYVDKVKISLSLIHQIGDANVIIQALKVSGTIKSGKNNI